ncbi:MAG: phosphotransferase [Candidatus Hydrogenedentota bacterium]
MSRAILFTQCLQNDFVQPLGANDPLPNLLHVGHEESRRLLGENPADGPIARLMSWAYGRPLEQLELIHLRDWHDPADPHQAAHLRQFGNHCLKETAGAAFAFPVPPHDGATVIDSLSLNDFDRTSLSDRLAPYAGRSLKVGIAGVWTEAKVFFLAYELATRFPTFSIAICSALTASSSRSQHFIALDQIARLLGVAVIPSQGGFMEFLGGDETSWASCRAPATDLPRVEFEDWNKTGEADRNLLRYIFRDCKSVTLRALAGGFSGNLVLGAESTDLFGHRQAPHVVKIGPRDAIGRERTAFERIESVLGNTAPRIADFADSGERGALKYRYASMSGGASTTIQKLYRDGIPVDELRGILRTVFVEQLGRFYSAATRESVNLLDYYSFRPDMAPRVRERVEAILGAPAAGESLTLPGRITCPNLCLFYENDLARFPSTRRDACLFSYVHGDLNGANIIVDGNRNVWIIDFFHAHRGHALRDLAKFENDLLYIFTPVTNEDDLRESARLSDLILGVENLHLPLPPVETVGLTRPAMIRAYETILLLRSFYSGLLPSDGDPLQLLIAQLRYAVHTLSFDEPDALQKKWALYTAGCCSAAVRNRMTKRAEMKG